MCTWFSAGHLPPSYFLSKFVAKRPAPLTTVYRPANMQLAKDSFRVPQVFDTRYFLEDVLRSSASSRLLLPEILINHV